MGTRADFYLGKGKDAEWLGSIAWDGYRDGICPQVLQCQSPEAFRHAVNDFLGKREDGTFPKDGWPWPWNNSRTSDCAYFHFDGRTWEVVCDFTQGDYDTRRHLYAPCDQEELNDEDEGYAERIAALVEVEYPDMTDKKKITMGPRSGLIVIGAD